jgi:DNA-binding transcriptional regulator LsrR (DeoR family)
MAKTIENIDKSEKAARAAWLYYVAQNSQDEIASKFGISRQVVQRMISQAVSEKLIRFSFDHPITRCMELGARLSEKFNLKSCDIVFSDPEAPALVTGIAIAGAAEMQKHLRSNTPKVIGIGTGLFPRACVEHLPSMECPQHTIVSLVGNLHIDGSATAKNVVERLADRVGAPHSPMPLPVLVRNPSELAQLHRLEFVAQTRALCKSADATFVGIANIDDTSPLVRDGFISVEESRALIKEGAVGEIIGWVYDKQGNLIPGLTNDRVTSAPLTPGNERPVVGLAVGQEKVPAILGALRGNLVNSLITDEATAEAVLELA